MTSVCVCLVFRPAALTARSQSSIAEIGQLWIVSDEPFTLVIAQFGEVLQSCLTGSVRRRANGAIGRGSALTTVRRCINC